MQVWGLGVLNTDKFTRTVQLRWPWYEWKEPTKMWVWMGQPCDEEDLHFFYASVTITVGNGARTPFSDSPCLHGRKPKDIAPLIYEASMRKNWKVREALKHNSWILRIKTLNSVSVEQVTQFFSLWMLLHEVELNEVTEAGIIWKHTNSGIYSTASAYKSQFLGLVLSRMDMVVWKAWAPPKFKFFAGWLYKTEFGPLIEASPSSAFYPAHCSHFSKDGDNDKAAVGGVVEDRTNQAAGSAAMSSVRWMISQGAVHAEPCLLPT
ncbi:Serine carboxypeptidase-like 18 [Hordeum vulgare]|nr:Serine carboxypeptidase-like 18 [Hordeum vulgare]